VTGPSALATEGRRHASHGRATRARRRAAAARAGEVEEVRSPVPSMRIPYARVITIRTRAMRACERAF
jgi:hypothetical protein